MAVFEVVHMNGETNLAEGDSYSAERDEATGGLVVEIHSEDENGEEVTVGTFDRVLSVQVLPDDEDDEAEDGDE